MVPGRIVLAAVLFLLSTTAFAATRAPDGVGPLGAAGVDNGTRIDINDIGMFVTNTGSFGFDQTTGVAGLEYPKGSGKTALFAGGLWVGAKVSGATRVTISEYSDEYRPGSASLNIPDNPYNADYKVYKLSRVYADPLVRDAALADYVAGAVPHGAPPVSVLGDGSLSISGDQMLWCVYNDLDVTAHTSQAGQTAPLGIEVQETVFAFDQPGPLARTVFIRFKLINRGYSILDSTVVSLWSDPDLGGPNDDLVGCSRTRSLGFAYNATGGDLLYGDAVPAIGIDLLQPPTNPAGVGNAGFGSFIKYINGTDPNTALKSYFSMQGLNPDGSTIIDPTTSLPTRFMVDGDPLTQLGWVDSNPSDRRMLISSGPFDMPPGQTRDMMVAIVIGQGDSYLGSVAKLGCDDDAVQAFVDAGFSGPAPGEPVCDEPTAISASLERVAAGPDYITLVWQLSGDGAQIATIERQVGSGVWNSLVTRAADGAGELVYHDTDVVPGGVYGYRLRISNGGVERWFGETSVRAPVSTRLALAGATPNPARSAISIAFSLPTGAPATLALYDLAGRRLRVIEVGSLGAGDHVVRLDLGAALANGVYVMRLTQGAQVLSARATVMR